MGGSRNVNCVETALQIEDHPLVSFLPLDLSSTESLETVVSHVDFVMQYGEDEEPKEVCRLFRLLGTPGDDGAHHRYVESLLAS